MPLCQTDKLKLIMFTHYNKHNTRMYDVISSLYIKKKRELWGHNQSKARVHLNIDVRNVGVVTLFLYSIHHISCVRNFNIYPPAGKKKSIAIRAWISVVKLNNLE